VKFRLGVVGLCLLVSGLALGTGQAIAAPVAGPGGRVSLQTPTPMQDTCATNSQTGTTTITLGAGQILSVIPIARQTAGTASVHACGAPANTGQVVFLFQPRRETVHRLLTDATSDCLTATSALDFVVEKVGDVAATPTADRLQYVPLATPIATLDRVISAGSVTVLNFTSATPGTVCIFTSASAHVLADIAGYSTTTPDTYWFTRLTRVSHLMREGDATQLMTDAASTARRLRLG
jgi:hypothetical protein